MNCPKYYFSFIFITSLFLQSSALWLRNPAQDQTLREIAMRFPVEVIVVHENRSGMCTGTLIDSSWILTAAHFQNEDFIYIPQFIPYDFSGSHVVVPHSMGQKMIPIKSVIKHPKFVYRQGIDYDAALVQLEKPMTEIKPIKRFRGKIAPGMNCWVAGYGDTNSGLERQVLRVGVNTVNNTAYASAPMSFIIGPANSPYSCKTQHGDSGGGNFINIKEPYSLNPPRSIEEFYEKFVLVGINEQMILNHRNLNTFCAKIYEPELNTWIDNVIIGAALGKF